MIIIDIGTGFVIFFALLATICVVGFAFSKEKKFPRILENKNASSANSINLIGTAFYGWKLLSKEQLEYYGLDPTDWHKQKYSEYGQDLKGLSLSERKFFPGFQTKFISILFPIIPVRSQIIFNKQDMGMESRFNAIPIQLYWKQAFGILAISYTSLLVITVILKIIL